LTYVEEINRMLRAKLEGSRRVVCFGQNIGAGSCLSGLTRNLLDTAGVEVINTPNCENSLVAFGFGMLLEGAHSIFFVKQLDFLLLSLDQLVNTFNMYRLDPSSGSFTIVPIVVDSGHEGPQSRLNHLADVASLTELPVFALPEPSAAKHILDRHLVAPGARLLAVSQRLLHSKLETSGCTPIDPDSEFFELEQGEDTALVAFNFAWPQARQLRTELAEHGIRASLFGVAASMPTQWDPLVSRLARASRIIVVDDSRSRNRPADQLRARLIDAGVTCPVLPLYRQCRLEDLAPNPDRFTLDGDHVRHWLRSCPRPVEVQHG